MSAEEEKNNSGPAEVSNSERSGSSGPPSESASDTQSSSDAVNRGIEYPGQHDVKLGRGGDANSHIGNIKFRQLINQYKPRYVAASRSNKPFVAEEVVQIWRNLEPPGRFLTRTDPSMGDDSTWHDVGDKRARKKASQALREKDRSEDFAATLGHGHGPFPGFAAAAAAAGIVNPPIINLAAQAQRAPLAASLATASSAASVASSHDQSRKREREEETGSQTRRVAPRQDNPATAAVNPMLAANALQQLLNPQQVTAANNGNLIQQPQAQVQPAPAAPAQAVQQLLGAAQNNAAAPGLAQQLSQLLGAHQQQAPAAQAPGPATNPLLLPALQLIVQQQQQQQQQAQQQLQLLQQLQQQQQQQPQNLSSLASALQALASTGQLSTPQILSALAAGAANQQSAPAPAPQPALAIAANAPAPQPAGLDRALASRLLETLLSPQSQPAGQQPRN